MIVMHSQHAFEKKSAALTAPPELFKSLVFTRIHHIPTQCSAPVRLELSRCNRANLIEALHALLHMRAVAG